MVLSSLQPKLSRHNLLLPVLNGPGDLDAQMGFEFDVRPAFLRIPGTREDKLLDFVARCPGNRLGLGDAITSR